MSTTYTPAPAETWAADGRGRHAPEAQPGHDAAPIGTRRARWPLFGVAGGVAAFAATVVGMPALEESDYISGVEVVDKLEAGQYRVAFVLGMISVGCLFAAAAGWRRWAEARAPRSLPARLVSQGLAATATVNIVFYGITGALGLYLPGGVEEATGMSREGLFVYHTMLDFGPLLGWWGAALAAVSVASLAFGKARLLPRWMGVVSVLLLIPPFGLALATSLPGFVGLTLPIWMVVTSIGMVASKSAHADA